MRQFAVLSLGLLGAAALVVAAWWFTWPSVSETPLPTPVVTADVMRDAMADAQKYTVTPLGAVRALLVPHHALVSPIMLGTLQGIVAGATPRRVIILGPDHQGHGVASMTTTSRDWSTVAGTVRSNRALAEQLITDVGVMEDDALAAREHGVYAMIPFIHQRWPAATVVTVALQYTTSESDVQRLADWMATHLGDGDLVVCSVDFSHYKSSLEADAEDVLSLAAITNIDTTAAWSVPVDSPPALAAVLRFAHQRNLSFQLATHTNSAKYSGNLASTSTTSYITGYFYTR